MCDLKTVETFLCNHKIWLDFMTAVGTVGASIIALIVSLATHHENEREKTSGVSIEGVDGDAVAVLVNRASTGLRIGVYRSSSFIDCTKRAEDYDQWINKKKLESINYLKVKDELMLSREERFSFHLANIDAGATYVALVAVKIEIKKTKFIFMPYTIKKYYLYRFNGVRAAQDPDFKDKHPLLKWNMEFAG